MPIVLTRATKQEARYKALGGSEHCSACRFYMPQGTCGRIIGPVSPEGWCKYYSREAVQRWSNPGYAGSGGGLPAGSTLNLDFMTPGTLDPRITFTRASTGTYFDSAGTMQTAAINAPRWDYDPVTLQSRGLLLEDQRTNLLLNSATLGTQSVAVTAQAYTLSFYGSGTITKSGTATGALVGTGPQRVTQTFTPTAGTLTLTVTGSVTNAQLEAGPFASSYIVTTGVSVTRAVDSCLIQIGNMSPWFVSPGGSWFAEFDYFNPTLANGSRVISRADAFNGVTPIQMLTSTAVNQFDGISLNGTVFTAPNTIVKAASTWAPGTAKLCALGGAVNTSAALVTGYGALATFGIRFMIGTGGNTCAGHMRRVSYWPRVLSDAEMQQVTT